MNELPRFSDAGGTLEARTLLLPFERSFVGREDRALEGKLKAEMSGIFNWALRGLYRLRTEGGFNTPAKSIELMGQYRRLTSPVSAFIEDRCEIRPGGRVPVDELYIAWGDWCKANGHEPGSKSTFGEHLRAAESTVTRRRAREDGKGDRVPVYENIILCP